MKLSLYYAPTTCALVPYVNLTEAGADFDIQAINMRKGQNNSPEFLALNPQHKVPVLLIDGAPLTENVAINTWIARQYPDARLFPSAPMDEIRAISLMGWFGSGIHPHLARINSPAKFCDAPGSADSVRAQAAKALDENFAIADKRLAGREFFFDHYTAPDVYFYWCLRRATQFELPVKKFGHCMAHFERMEQRASVKNVLAFEKATLDRFAA